LFPTSIFRCLENYLLFSETIKNKTNSTRTHPNRIGYNKTALGEMSKISSTVFKHQQISLKKKGMTQVPCCFILLLDIFVQERKRRKTKEKD